MQWRADMARADDDPHDYGLTCGLNVGVTVLDEL